jgi:hypothetical protein
MLIHLHRLRERGWPIPKYQFAFKKSIPGEITVREDRDPILNRHTRIARLHDPVTGKFLDIPPLLDVQLVGLTREAMSLSGIERVEDELRGRTEDFAQTWLCILEADGDAG